MILKALSNECVNEKTPRYVVIVTAVVMVFAILLGCVSQDKCRLAGIASDADNVTIGKKMKLKKLRYDYKMRFKWGLCMSFGSYEDDILFHEYSLKNNIPPHPSYSWQMMNRILYLAKYELLFNRKVPNCQLTDDTSSVLWLPGDSIYNPVCDFYLDYLIRNAYKNKVPILDEIITVTVLDLWIAYYMEVFGDISLPVWFQEYPDSDKVVFLENTFKRACVFAHFHGGCQVTDYYPYLSTEEEGTIKTELKKQVAEYEKTSGRQMTELEMTVAQFEIQFGKPPPICEQCTDEEYLAVLRHVIQMNSRSHPWHIPKSFNRDVARSLYQKSGRKMTAAEMIAAEFEIRFGRQLVCPQCTDEDLLTVWKHYGLRIWRHFGTTPDSIPQVVNEDLLRSLKEEKYRNPCCPE